MNISPLRYPGSKNKCVKYIKHILDYNEIIPKILVEPFAGGASVSIYFLINNLIEKLIISDRDKVVSSFWKVVFSSDVNKLIRFIHGVKINIRNFKKYKKIAQDCDKRNDLDLAKACIFLNRTSFSGMLRNGTGPIGGYDQLSKYPIYCRFNKKKIIEKIKYLNSFKSRVKVLNSDWEETFDFIEKKYKNTEETIVFYLDPPFYNKAEDIYRYYFNEDQHIKLRDAISKLNSPWILSYDRNKRIEELYEIFDNVHISLPYSINSHATRIEKELIISKLNMPLQEQLGGIQVPNISNIFETVR